MRRAVSASLLVLLLGCEDEGLLVEVATPPPETEETPEPREVEVRINEISAAGGVPVVPGSEHDPDWIELENSTDEVVDVGGWYLTDDPDDLTKFALPTRTLEPGGHVVVIASDVPVEGVEESFRAPFLLRSSGEYLALVEPDGETIHDGFPGDYPEQRYGITYGVVPETGERRYFDEPTPSRTNVGPGWIGFTTDPVPDVPRGFHEERFAVTLTSDEDASIYVALDGSAPLEEPEYLVDGPLQVETTSFLKAVARRPEYLPSRIVAHTYLFLDDILQQPAAPEGYPPVWQPNVTADYAMDPSVGSPEDIKEALRAFPTLSLVMPIIDWFHPSNDPDQGGIYSNSTIARGREWERVGTAEFFDFDHGEEIQVVAGIRVYGNASRATSRPKHNLRVVFRREYGAGTLDFPLFGDDDVPESVNSVLLRGQNGDSWIHPNGTQRTEALYIRDQFARSLHAAMGRPEIPQGHVHLYINGMYWGLYHTIERIEDKSMVRNFGGLEEEWDVLKSSPRNPNGMAIVAGNLDAWAELQNLAVAVGAGEAEFSALDEHLDLGHFIDFLLVNFWNGNRDWDHNNFQAARRRTGGDHWRFFVWDSERTMLAGNHDSTTKDVTGRATAIHQRLMDRPEYRAAFSERVALHLENGGVLSADGVRDEFLGWVELLRVPLLAESSRWGDAHRSGNPYTVDVQWQNEVDRRLENYFPVRTTTVLGQLDADGLR